MTEGMKPEDYNLEMVNTLAGTNYIIHAAVQAHRHGQLKTCEQWLCFTILQLHKQNQELMKIAEDLIKNKPPAPILISKEQLEFLNKKDEA